MGEDTNQGNGYVILDLRLKQAEKEIEDLKRELKELSRDNVKEFVEVHERIDKLHEFTIEVKMMLANFTTSQSEMKTDIKTIAASAGKDQGWRALLTDIIKIAGIILGFILGGKWLG